MTPVQRLVTALQQALGICVPKGQIVLNMADDRFQNAEIRVSGIREPVDKTPVMRA